MAPSAFCPCWAAPAPAPCDGRPARPLDASRVTAGAASPRQPTVFRYHASPRAPARRGPPPPTYLQPPAQGARSPPTLAPTSEASSPADSVLSLPLAGALAGGAPLRRADSSLSLPLPGAPRVVFGPAAPPSTPALLDRRVEASPSALLATTAAATRGLDEPPALAGGITPLDASARSAQRGPWSRELEGLRAELRDYCSEVVEVVRRQVADLQDELFLLKSSARSGGVSPEAASACDDAAAGAAAACGGAVAEAMRQPDAEDAAEARWPPDAEERWAQQLEAERLTRAAHLAELHARIGRDVADVTCRLEQQRLALLEDAARLDRATREALDGLRSAQAHAQEAHAGELTELRATLESVWRSVSGGSSTGPRQEFRGQLLKFEPEDGGEDRYKQFDGDHEDVFALYDMVREVLGEQEHLRQRLGELEAARPTAGRQAAGAGGPPRSARQ